MQDDPDYQRGYQKALVAAKGGWALCWLDARELAITAVYSPHGLSAERQGYAVGLEECFPEGGCEVPRFLQGPLYPEPEIRRAADPTPPSMPAILPGAEVGAVGEKEGK